MSLNKNCTQWVVFWNKDFTERGIAAEARWNDWLENDPVQCRDSDNKKFQFRSFEGTYEEAIAIRDVVRADVKDE